MAWVLGQGTSYRPNLKEQQENESETEVGEGRKERVSGERSYLPI